MPTKRIKVATFNANSVRSRIELVVDWLQREQPDAFALQETKVQDADFPADAFTRVGYRVAFRGQKAYSGVAIATREELQDVSYGLDDGGEPDEARLIRGTLRGIPIVNTYVPQGQSVDSDKFQYKLDWLARLRRWFERHYSPEKPLLWVGDLNVAPEPMDVHDPKRLGITPSGTTACPRHWNTIVAGEWITSGLHDRLPTNPVTAGSTSRHVEHPNHPTILSWWPSSRSEPLCTLRCSIAGVVR